MPYDIRFIPVVLDQLRALTARERGVIMDSIEQQLRHQPDVPTKNRKPMRPNPVAPWELRIGDMRVFYDFEQATQVVAVLAVGIKKGNRVWIGTEEFRL